MGEWLGMGTVMGINSIEEGPGMGWIDGIKEGPRSGTGWIDGTREGPGMGWEFDEDSVEVDNHELVMWQYHTFVEIEIQ